MNFAISAVRNVLISKPGPASAIDWTIVFLNVCTSITKALSKIKVGRNIKSIKCGSK